MANVERNEVLDRELHDQDIHWLLNMAAAALGQRSAHQGLVSVLEHAGFPTGVPETDIYDDRHVGWGKFREGDVAKWRRLIVVWRAVPKPEQAVLAAHYCGARGGLPAELWARVDGALGQFAAAALWIHHGEALVKLIDVCADSGRQGRKDALKMAAKRVEKAVRGAHQAWVAARAAQDTPEAHLPWQDAAAGIVERIQERRETDEAWAATTEAVKARLGVGDAAS